MNNELRIKREGSGFTVLEILIVIAILFIIAALTLFSFSSLNRSQILERNASSAVSFLEEARSLTISSKDASSYGVFFDDSENRLILFKGGDFNSGEEIKIFSFHSSVEVSQMELGDGTETEVVFKRLTGETEQDGFVVLSLTADPQSLETINIFSTGLVELE